MASRLRAMPRQAAKPAMMELLFVDKADDTVGLGLGVGVEEATKAVVVDKAKLLAPNEEVVAVAARAGMVVSTRYP